MYIILEKYRKVLYINLPSFLPCGKSTTIEKIRADESVQCPEKVIHLDRYKIVSVVSEELLREVTLQPEQSRSGYIRLRT